MPCSKKIVFMGVCGSGKSTLAAWAAQYLGCPAVIEADTFHTPEMKEKMRGGVPLTDEDRWPWLERLNEALRESAPGAAIATCSALRRSYRERLSLGLAGSIHFIFLDAPPDVLQARLKARQHEYMPPSLLASQFATLEVPEAGERVSVVSVAGSMAETETRLKEVLDSLG